MKFAVINNGIVINIVEAEESFGLSNGWIASTSACIGYIYDGVNFNQPVETNQMLSDAKIAKNLQINQWRENANFSSFTWQAKQIACDQLSRSDIDGVMGYIALNNALPAGWPGGWKAIDNTFISIPDVATFNSMYQAMVATGTANFTHSQNLKTSVTNALTVADVNSIVW